MLKVRVASDEKDFYFPLLYVLFLTAPAWANQRTVNDAEAIVLQALQHDNDGNAVKNAH